MDCISGRLKISISSLAHDVPRLLREGPLYMLIEERCIQPANAYFPESEEITISVPYVEEGNIVAFLERYALAEPKVNKGCEKPARWMRFPMDTPQSCVTNVYAIEDDSTDKDHLWYLVSY